MPNLNDVPDHHFDLKPTQHSFIIFEDQNILLIPRENPSWFSCLREPRKSFLKKKKKKKKKDLSLSR